MTYTQFQSAPRSLDRGDSSAPARLSSFTSFNPRPGHSTGATQTFAAALSVVHRVSIRAPVTRPGRHQIATGDADQLHSFNPRPGHSTGATCRPTPQHRSAIVVSIRAPVTRPGRLDNRDRLLSAVMTVSIRAPVTRPGRHGVAWRDGICQCFNPRPGHSTGATEWPEESCEASEVSIRAPVTRPGRLTTETVF